MGAYSPDLLPRSKVDDFMIVSEQYLSTLCQNSNHNQVLLIFTHQFKDIWTGQNLPLPSGKLSMEDHHFQLAISMAIFNSYLIITRG